MHTVRLKMAGKLDRNKDEYYLLVPKLPMMIDLSKAALLVHPWEEDDGSFGAQLTIRYDTFNETRRDKDEDEETG